MTPAPRAPIAHRVANRPPYNAELEAALALLPQPTYFDIRELDSRRAIERSQPVEAVLASREISFQQCVVAGPRGGIP